jgi:hypothetical protein
MPRSAGVPPATALIVYPQMAADILSSADDADVRRLIHSRACGAEVRRLRTERRQNQIRHPARRPPGPATGRHEAPEMRDPVGQAPARAALGPGSA